MKSQKTHVGVDGAMVTLWPDA